MGTIAVHSRLGRLRSVGRRRLGRRLLTGAFTGAGIGPFARRGFQRAAGHCAGRGHLERSSSRRASASACGPVEVLGPNRSRFRGAGVVSLQACCGIRRSWSFRVSASAVAVARHSPVSHTSLLLRPSFAAGLSGTEGRRCARISAARTGPSARRVVLLVQLLTTSTSSSLLRLAAGLILMLRNKSLPSDALVTVPTGRPLGKIWSPPLVSNVFSGLHLLVGS